MIRKSIAISGAASGIGLATARLFAERGWFVACLDRNASLLDSLADEIGRETALFISADVADRAELLDAVAQIGAATGGTLDLLHNNAGIDAKGPFASMEWSTIERVIHINLLGGMSLIHAAYPLLKATPGSLCFSTASGSAIFGTANLGAYSASKHGIKGLTEALSVEFAADGVRAADVLPGIIDTGMLTPEVKAMLPQEGPWRVMPPSSIAEAVWDAYHGDKLHYYVPAELAEMDVMVTAQPEAMRDDRIANPPL